MASTNCDTTLNDAEKANQTREYTIIRDKFTPPMQRIVLLMCGSFNPVTIAHLRMLELARDYYHHRSIQVLRGIVSPVSDLYGKAGLAKVDYRIEMLQAAIRDNKWLRVDTWEAEQTSWTRTKLVLDHHQKQIKEEFGEDVKLRFLAGADVVRSMLNAKVWLPQDIDDIMTNYGVACITRLTPSEPGPADAKMPDVKDDMPDLWKQNIEVIQDWVVNDISSTNIRKQLASGCSIKYIVPDGTIELIRKYGLYSSDKSVHLAEWPCEKN